MGKSAPGTTQPYTNSYASSRLKRSKLKASSTEMSLEDGSQVDMAPRQVGQYVELHDRKSDYNGLEYEPPANVSRVSAAAARYNGAEYEKHGIRKTVTVETLRQSEARGKAGERR